MRYITSWVALCGLLLAAIFAAASILQWHRHHKVVDSPQWKDQFCESQEAPAYHNWIDESCRAAIR